MKPAIKFAFQVILTFLMTVVLMPVLTIAGLCLGAAIGALVGGLGPLVLLCGFRAGHAKAVQFQKIMSGESIQ